MKDCPGTELAFRAAGSIWIGSVVAAALAARRICFHMMTVVNCFSDRCWIQLFLSREPGGRAVICHGASITVFVLVCDINCRPMQLNWQSVWQSHYRLEEKGAIMSLLHQSDASVGLEATCRVSPHQLG